MPGIVQKLNELIESYWVKFTHRKGDIKTKIL